MTDFLVRELPDVVARFATDFDGLPEAVEGFSGSRMLSSAPLVRAFVVYGLLIVDDAMELMGIDLDLDA